MAGRNFFVIGFVCVVAAICGSIGLHLQSSAAAEPQGERLVKISYRTADLPIWTQNGTGYDHSILIALLKANIGDENWDDAHSISPYPQNVSLVVSTTKGNHAVVATTLDQLRLDRFKRSPEFKRSTR